MKSRTKNYLFNLIFPAFVFGSITGVLTAIVVVLYKVFASHVIEFSEHAYEYLRHNLYLLPIIIVALFGIALLFSLIYKKEPNLQGGGIPTSIGVLRGQIGFKWPRNLFGVFFLSLITFLIGVPLGNEGPSVQMGTAVGSGSVAWLAPKERAWRRYAMTGGACAGFAVATGASVSGIMFAIEEAHQRISPMIIIVAATSVMFARITTELLATLFDISISLFPIINLIPLSIQNIWIPIAIGLAIGLFAVIFLKYYHFIKNVSSKILKKVSQSHIIFFIFILTLIAGLFSFSFISTGHHLLLSLFEDHLPLYMLFLVLAVRSTLTLLANGNGITGGIFLPILALGALVSAILGNIAQNFFGLNNEYYTLILVLGITACISSMMKMPLTAIVFSIEALGCYNNIIYVIIVSAISFAITEIFGAKSINDSVVESKIEKLNEGKTPIIIDTFVTVKKGSFAVGKQIRDILWPANLFVLSLKHDELKRAEVDEHGEKAIRDGDILHIRYSTLNEKRTKSELVAIVGDENYCENETDQV